MYEYICNNVTNIAERLEDNIMEEKMIKILLYRQIEKQKRSLLFTKIKVIELVMRTNLYKKNFKRKKYIYNKVD